MSYFYELTAVSLPESHTPLTYPSLHKKPCVIVLQMAALCQELGSWFMNIFYQMERICMDFVLDQLHTVKLEAYQVPPEAWETGQGKHCANIIPATAPV